MKDNIVKTQNITNKEAVINNIIKKKKSKIKKDKNLSNYVKIWGFDKLVNNTKSLSDEEKLAAFNEFENLKIWVKTLLSIYGSLPNIIKIVDQIIENSASNPFAVSHFCAVDTFGQIEKVIDFYERKNKLLNLNYMIEKMFLGLDDYERKLVEMKYMNKSTMDTIAQKLKIEKRGVYRKYERLIKKLACYCLKSGWTTFFITTQIDNEPWIYEQYNQFKKENELYVKKPKINF